MHLCTVKTVIWQICSNRPGKKVPQSARLSEGGGCNRYLGNAQIEVPLTVLGLPLSSWLPLSCHSDSPKGKWKTSTAQIGTFCRESFILKFSLNLKLRFTLRGKKCFNLYNCKNCFKLDFENWPWIVYGSITVKNGFSINTCTRSENEGAKFK